MTDPKVTATVAKIEDQTVQITFSVPATLIKSTQEQVLQEYASQAEIPGFRKGKAPLEKVKERISAETLTEKTLTKILPTALGEAITTHKLKPAVYPKFELVSAPDNDAWQIRAVTCELPTVNLGDYQRILAGTGKAKAIWTPGQDKPNAKSAEMTREEKEQQVIHLLLENIKVKVPSLLVKEETDNRLATLLARLEKLGLNLESYLKSLGKTPDGLRKEYEAQSEQTLALELILNAVVAERQIKIEEAQIDTALKTAGVQLEKDEEAARQRLLIKSILARRTALDYLTSLL